MRKPFLIAIAGLAMTGCGSDPDPNPVVDAGGGEPVADVCAINEASEPFPGFPFDVQKFNNEIYPLMTTSCYAGCHAEDIASGGFVVFQAPATTECPENQTFNAFKANSNYKNQTNVANSVMITAFDEGKIPSHGGIPATTVTLFTDFINSAAVVYAEENGDGGDTSNFFDADDYESIVQPALDNAGCTGVGCHDDITAQSGFGLVPNPQPGSAEMTANLKKVIAYVDLAAGDADETVLYEKSTDNHAGKTINNIDPLEGWIQAALDLNDDGNPVTGCVDPTQFNTGVFRDEIMPLLRGDVDYNDIDSGRTSTGCTRSECHGRDRGAGTFYIDVNASEEEQVEAFSCFVNLANPSQSQVLLCPLDLNGCQAPGNDHPGEDIFDGVTDLNYQKLLAFIYATDEGKTPLDFAFFARKVNTIYNDEDAVDDGQANLTCASSGCHRSVFAGQVENGSNFGIIPNAFQEPDVFLNFIQSANFTFFPDATQSSLFLYPTNEIANADNPLALVGVEHPIVAFDVDSQFALDILKFAGGIRPNANGFLQDMLVAGLFPASDVNDDVLGNEREELPRIFDRSGAGQNFNSGLWDGFFAVEDVNDADAINTIDFLKAFEIDENEADNQIAIAVAYVINTDSDDIRITANVQSENDIELFFGDNEGQGRDGNLASATITLDPFEDVVAANNGETGVTRIMVKLFKADDEETFAFQIQFEDEDGNIFDENDPELVFTLSAEEAGI